MAKTPAKRAVGRPTKYDPDYCNQVIDFMRDGYSLTAFGVHILVARSTLNEWIDNHPEFSEAVKIAQGARTLVLEKGLLKDEASGANVTSRIFALKNAAPEEWKDKVQQELTGANGGAIKNELTVSFLD